MFVFIIPRTPKKFRSLLRNELWELSKKSLMEQTSKNWKAIIIGDVSGEVLDPVHFEILPFDGGTKKDKIKIALDYISNKKDLENIYVIRFDDDDIFSRVILSEIEKLPLKYDCYFDKYHTYIDAVYLKMSQKVNPWIPNTAIHKYSNAVKVCGSAHLPLLLQDHSEYWHIYYSDKNVYRAAAKQPLYFRILTPVSITSSGSMVNGKIDWKKHLHYLNGYGPWIGIPSVFPYKQDFSKLSNAYFGDRPAISQVYWFINKLKNLRLKK